MAVFNHASTYSIFSDIKLLSSNDLLSSVYHILFGTNQENLTLSQSKSSLTIARLSRFEHAAYELCFHPKGFVFVLPMT